MKFRTIETQIPWKYKWKAIDEDGSIYIYIKKPKQGTYGWLGDGYIRSIGIGPKPKDWTKTLERLENLDIREREERYGD